MIDDTEDSGEETRVFQKQMECQHRCLEEALGIGLSQKHLRVPISTIVRYMSMDWRHYFQEAYGGGSVGLGLVHPIHNAVMDGGVEFLVVQRGALIQHATLAGDKQCEIPAPYMRLVRLGDLKILNDDVWRGRLIFM